MTMVSPFEGRITAHWRGYPGHKGTDIAPPKPGQTGLPVYAAFSGTIKRIARGVPHGNKRSTWAPGRTGNGMLVANPDGEGNGYNHMRPLSSLSVGDRIVAGQLIGYNDTSGNQSGPHLHFELWANWRNPNSDYDARAAFDKFKVKMGSAPKLPGNVKPATSKPVRPSKPTSNQKNSKEDNIAIQKALTAMGLDVGYPDGVDGPGQKRGVTAFQKHHGLHPDGHWGSITQERYEYNKRLQNALNQMKSSTPKLRVDGWIGKPTIARQNDVLKRNKWAKKNLVKNLKAVKAW